MTFRKAIPLLLLRGSSPEDILWELPIGWDNQGDTKVGWVWGVRSLNGRRKNWKGNLGYSLGPSLSMLWLKPMVWVSGLIFAPVLDPIWHLRHAGMHCGAERARGQDLGTLLALSVTVLTGSITSCLGRTGCRLFQAWSLHPWASSGNCFSKDSISPWICLITHPSSASDSPDFTCRLSRCQVLSIKHCKHLISQNPPATPWSKSFFSKDTRLGP